MSTAHEVELCIGWDRMHADRMDEMTSLRRIMLLDELAEALAEEVSAGLASLGHPGLRPARWFALATIADMLPCTAVLARWLRITRQSASELVHFAVQEGYVNRMPAHGSRRSVPLRLTAKGEATIEAAEQIAAEAIFRWSGAGSAEPPDRAFEVVSRMVGFDRWRRQSAWAPSHLKAALHAQRSARQGSAARRS